MKALVFEGIPNCQDFDGSHTASVSGTNVYREEVVRALLRHGTYDAYFFLWRTPFLPIPEGGPAKLKSLDRRTRVITVTDLEQVHAYDEVVLFTPVPYINSLLPLRSEPRSAHWLASGVIHSLDGWDTPGLLMSLMHSGIDAADSLMCSSQAGKTVVENIFAAAAAVRGRRDDSAPPAIPDAARRPSLPVVPLGIDCRPYLRTDREAIRSGLGLSPDTCVVLYLGRIAPVSKADLTPLLYAVARARRAHPDLRLVIAGDDTQHSMAGLLRAAAQEAGCGDCVEVRPNIGDDEKARLLAAADIFVSPSDNTQETFGLTIVEAMAAGLPVVASDWNGYKELVAHGETGFLIPTYWVPLGEDLDRLATGSFMFRNILLAVTTVVDVGELEARLRLLIANPELRKAMGETARRRALERYDWSAIIRGYEAVWGDGFARARELRGARGDVAHSPSHYPYQKIFGHYPTRTLSEREAVEVTDAGRRFLRADAAADLIISPNGVTDPGRLRRLLQLADELGPLAIADLAGHAAEKGGVPRLIAFADIAFSLKYDYLRLLRGGRVE